MASYDMVAASALDEAKSRGVILDVRTVPEHEDCRLLYPHEFVPLDRLDPKEFMLRRGLDREADVFILCKAGTRAKAAAEKFISAGYPNMHVIEGGILACESAGEKLSAPTGAAPQPMPSPGKKVISLERQVRILAGAIGATGALVALLGHPLVAVGPLFIGCGMVFAGVTDHCGMAYMLGRLPWNQGSSCGTSACASPVRPNSIPPSNGSAGGCA
jgi:rhodanese-related sulfurtransferase